MHILSIGLLELLDDVVDKLCVEVFTPEMTVTVSCQGLEITLVKLEDRDIESAATEIVDEHLLLLGGFCVRLIKAVRDGGSCRLIDYAHHIQASNPASVFSRLPLVLVEVGRDCDDNIFDVALKNLGSSFL